MEKGRVGVGVGVPEEAGGGGGGGSSIFALHCVASPGRV